MFPPKLGLTSHSLPTSLSSHVPSFVIVGDDDHDNCCFIFPILSPPSHASSSSKHSRPVILPPIVPTLGLPQRAVLRSATWENLEIEREKSSTDDNHSDDHIYIIVSTTHLLPLGTRSVQCEEPDRLIMCKKIFTPRIMFLLPCCDVEYYRRLWHFQT